jgi:hypothetical protein
MKMLKALVVTGLIVGTGYMLDLCFYGMNQKNDSSYVGGIFGLVIWCVAVTLVLQFMFKRRKSDEKDNSTKHGVSGTGVGSGMHDENRPRNGGNRG